MKDRSTTGANVIRFAFVRICEKTIGLWTNERSTGCVRGRCGGRSGSTYEHELVTNSITIQGFCTFARGRPWRNADQSLGIKDSTSRTRLNYFIFKTFSSDKLQVSYSRISSAIYANEIIRSASSRNGEVSVVCARKSSGLCCGRLSCGRDCNK